MRRSIGAAAVLGALLLALAGCDSQGTVVGVHGDKMTLVPSQGHGRGTIEVTHVPNCDVGDHYQVTDGKYVCS